MKLDKFVLKYILIVVALIAGWVVISMNSYGTGDVEYWLNISKEFVEYGFWPKYYSLTDIPMLAIMYVYFSGLVTHFTYGVINQYTFPGILKIFQIPALLIMAILPVMFIKNKFRAKKLLIPITLMTMLNPAIILNLGFLGYLDVLFIASLLICIYLIYRIENKIGNIYINAALFSALFVISPFIKPQFVMFIPVIGLIGAILIIRNKLLKVSIWGALAGVTLLALLVSLGAQDFREFALRIFWTKDIYEKRIIGQSFVVANFPNIWQISNFIERQCKFDCSLHEIFFVRPKYWVDKNIADAGKNVFFVALAFYVILFVKGLFSKASTELRKSYTHITIVACLWMNVLYSFFNTAVHENHLAATVSLAILLYAYKPTPRNFKIFLFFTTLNAINLYYYYGFGMAAFFGYWPPHKFYDFSIPMLLIIVYTGLLVYYTWRLIKGYLE